MTGGRVSSGPWVPRPAWAVRCRRRSIGRSLPRGGPGRGCPAAWVTTGRKSRPAGFRRGQGNVRLGREKYSRPQSSEVMSDDAHFRSGRAGIRSPWTVPKPCGRPGSVELFGPERGPVNISSVTCRRTREFRCRPVGERRPSGGAAHEAGRAGAWAPQSPRTESATIRRSRVPDEARMPGRPTGCVHGSESGPSSHFQVPGTRTVRVRLTTNGTSHVGPPVGLRSFEPSTSISMLVQPTAPVIDRMHAVTS